ncbi:hypothetical protein AHF37_08659 [Paragonimus kellicotti]|nr:hypothetical protein AHF37_08659 [Paragonimus kellicotti]
MRTSEVLLLTCLVSIVNPRLSEPLLVHNKHPVILIPGDGGSRVYYRPKTSPIPCPRLMWLTLQFFILPNYFTQVFDYFSQLVSALVKDPFFQRNISVRGAPYDFRRAPNENQWFQYALSQLIEDTYHRNGLSPVVLVAHILATTTRSSQRPVANANSTPVPTSSRSSGILEPMSWPHIPAGENAGAFFVSPLVFRRLHRSFPSLTFMSPDPRLWSPNEQIVITPKRNYSAHEMRQFFDYINYADGYQMMEATKAGHDFFEGPTDVEEVYCVYGTQVATMEQLIYTTSSQDQIPQLVEGDGDGTVNLRSLEVCHRWKKVIPIPLPGGEHRAILKDERLIELIRQVAGFS